MKLDERLKRVDDIEKTVNQSKGITIIALVITIIVLIILAGVAINLTLGENGLLNRTKEAREKYEIASAKEYIELKIDECIIEKGGEASLQDIIDYLAEDSSVTYYVALEEVGLVAGEVDIGSPKEIYVVYNRYQFKVDEDKKVEFISIVDVDLEGKVSIDAQVKEYLGKNSEGKYEVSVLLKATGEAEISKLEIENPDGTSLTLEPDGLTTIGKDITIEFDKTYKVILTTANGHKYTKKIIEKTEETIMNAEQLASFRDRVNSGLTYEGKTVKLGADIDLSTVCGKVDGTIENDKSFTKANTFNGIFDGMNHTINNLYINSNGQQAIFNEIEKDGIIKNITIENGYVNSTDSKAAILVVSNKGIIENIIINSGTVKGTLESGGIVCNNYKKIGMCVNKAEITYNNASAGQYIGGISGQNVDGNAIIEKCINQGTITGGWAIGGIVGYCKKGTVNECINYGKIIAVKCWNNPCDAGIAGAAAYDDTAVITNCYNMGTISSTGAAGGIIGFTLGASGNITLKNCYSAGNIEGTMQYSGTARGGIVGYKASSGKFNISNNYWTAINGISSGMGYTGGNTGCSLKTANELSNMSTTLGESFTNDVKVKVIDESTGEEKEAWKYNNGYPILKWQLQENQLTE